MYGRISRYLVIAIIGIVFIIAGIYHWPVPTIHWGLRRTKYGEIINSIVTIFIGIMICILAASSVIGDIFK